ncbi:MAG TPA: OmpA family protein [Anaeromyxobacter sp.]|nr:OmpA family protein [Anaeromyxobacter sp.]
MRISSFIAVALAAAAFGCATTETTKSTSGGVAGGYSQPMCMPCPNPCSPDSSCGQAVAAAPKPAPAPAPAPVVRPPPPPAVAAEARFDPAPGSFAKPQMVALSSPTPGAVIRYTTDGSEPTAASAVYAGPIAVDKNTTIRAVASAPGMTDSPAARGAYAIEPPPPPAAPARVVVTKQKVELKEKVFFETGKTTIKPASFSLLDEAASVLKEHPDVKKVVVEGHTDDRGEAAFNQKLSEGRAKAVLEYLVGKGVAAERLQAKGFGETKPVADNKTAQGREANRRVELMIAE